MYQDTPSSNDNILDCFIEINRFVVGGVFGDASGRRRSAIQQHNNALVAQDKKQAKRTSPVLMITPEHGLAGLVLFLAGYQVSNGIVGVQIGSREIAADLLH